MSRQRSDRQKKNRAGNVNEKEGGINCHEVMVFISTKKSEISYDFASDIEIQRVQKITMGV